MNILMDIMIHPLDPVWFRWAELFFVRVDDINNYAHDEDDRPSNPHHVMMRL
ncbi:uncharacterized protein FFB20_05114 [Fusarium fujikuroi]|nr:uncharacterized protein FFE2_01366 [Fusarium fujikuroi]SCN71875.1 uncharacterized protein FFC1_01360 [Fusarium fujikuroi]SCN75374.1 uncharacterized protein FFM5_01316 [Fusarium fujikuroi]SCN75997.1 uncharacterized protein FFB20_05114 [Fusarium fujikuroi]SCO28145.1 uncharacterized protein FFMR_00869 [Fusarium fujikuroi]